MEKNENKTTLIAALGAAEVVIDVITSNDVLASIPIIGTAINILNLGDSIRDRAFRMKLKSFAQGLSKISERDRSDFAKRLEEDAEELSKAGELLFLVLDGISDIEKPKVIGYLFLSYIREKISYGEMKLLSQAVAMSFAEDLIYLVESAEDLQKSQYDWMRRLSASGLTETMAGQTYGDLGQVYFKTTSLGEKLRKSYVEASRGGA